MEIPAALEALVELLRTTKDPHNNDVRRCSRRLDRAVLHSLQMTTGHVHVEALIVLVTMDTPAIHESTVLSACQRLQQQQQQHDGNGDYHHSHDYDHMLQSDHIDALMDRIASLYRLDLQDSPIGMALLQLITTTCQDYDESSCLLLNGMETIQLLQLLLPPTIQELSRRWNPRDDCDHHVYNKRSFVLLVLKHLESLIPTTTTVHTQDNCQNVVRRRLQEVTLWLRQHCGPTTNNTTTTATSNTITTTFLCLLYTIAEEMVEYSLDAMNDTDSTTTAEQVMPHVSLASIMVQLLQDGLGVVVATSTVSSLVTTLAMYVASLPIEDHGIAVPLLVHLVQTMVDPLPFSEKEEAICIAMLSDVDNGHTWITPTISTCSSSNSILLTRTRQVVAMASMVLAQSATVTLEACAAEKNDPWQALLVRQKQDRQHQQQQ